MGRFFERFDLLLIPAMQLTAFPVGVAVAARRSTGEPVDPFFDDWCTFCLPANLTGQPVDLGPAGFGDDGLPVGLQIIGRRFADARSWRPPRRSSGCCRGRTLAAGVGRRGGLSLSGGQRARAVARRARVRVVANVDGREARAGGAPRARRRYRAAHREDGRALDRGAAAVAT